VNNKWSNIFLGSVLLFNSTGSVASLLLGPDLLGYSAGAGAGATDVFSRSGNIYAGAAVVVGADGRAANINSGAAITVGASASAKVSSAPVISLYRENVDIEKAIEQITSAQESLFDLEHDFELDVGIASTAFDPGVYKGTALTVGARNKFEIINTGGGASVIWNLGSALGFGCWL
jgi:hypothetical protein